MRNVIAIVGNTGVGKSQLAVELAKYFGGEIINADALQMYHGLPIVTNKHPIAERQGIPHHLLGFLPWSTSDYTVQSFERDALDLIDQLHDSGKLPILVGGTTYYIQSLLTDQNLIRPTEQLTEKQRMLLDDPIAVDRELSAVDPAARAKFHPNDHRRLRRALEIWYTTGQRASDIYFQQRSSMRFRVFLLWIQCDRRVLVERLDQRVRTMMEGGLEDEMRAMFDYYREQEHKQAQGIWQVLGFRQFLPYLQGQIPIEEAISHLQAETRQYAKRQTKWIRNKLIPSWTGLDGYTLAVLNSTNLGEWTKEVQERAIILTAEWLSRMPFTQPLIPKDADIDRRAPEFGPSQWVQRRCETCSLRAGSDVIVLGDDAWQTHLASKGHRTSSISEKLCPPHNQFKDVKQNTS